LVGGPGNDTIDGGNGVDTIFGSTGNDTIDGGTNTDTLIGGPGDDSIFGGAGPDIIFGSGGVDNLRGNGGDDTIDGGPEADRIRGAGGTDACETDIDVQGCEGPLPAAGGSTTWTRVYDGDRRLVSVSSDDGTTTEAWELTWDMAMGVPEIQSWETSAGVTNFVYGNEPIGLVDPAGTTGLFAMSALGDTVETPTSVGYAVADTPGPYGQTDPTAVQPLFGYRGELHLGTQIHLRARDLTPDLARFNTPDPLDGVNGTPTVASLYAYANNNPTDLSDPQGLRPNVDADSGQRVRLTMDDAGCSGQLTYSADGAMYCTNDPGGFIAGAINENVIAPVTGLWSGYEAIFDDPTVLIKGWDQIYAGGQAYYEEYGWDAVRIVATEAFQDAYIDPLIGCLDSSGDSYRQGADCGATALNALEFLPLARLGPNTQTRPTSLADNLACSFSADTEVLMADGSTEPISQIVIGDWVLAEDPETGERGAREVTRLWVHPDTLVDLEINGVDVTTTEDHPFWNATDSEWQRADALDRGDLVLTADGDLLAVDGIDWATATTGTAYNLTINDLNTYYIAIGDEQVLVHNSNTCSLIGQDSRLVREADKLGSSQQRSVDALTSQLANGNLNPGIGTKNVFGNIFEARAIDGARVYFQQSGGQITIVAKSTKTNQSRVISILEGLYG